jgi:hypothetical protein
MTVNSSNKVIHNYRLPVHNYLATPHLSAELSTDWTRMLRLVLLATARQVARCAGLSVLALLLLTPSAHASEQNDVIVYQSFAHLLVKDNKQMVCLIKLYYEESRWNPRAVNNGHYGIPQGKSKWLATANPYEQIEWGVAYNRARYGNMCDAYKHWRRFNWH